MSAAVEPLPESNIKAVSVRRPRAVAPAAPGPLDIVQAALASGNVEMYREAVGLMKEMDAFAARKAFNNALADAKAELPIIEKNRLVAYDRKGGGETRYWHEDLAQVVDTVTPILSKFGLSHRWKLHGKPGEPVTVICVISHRDGHQEENDLSAGADTSDGKNPIQGIKSAVSYLERITLMASLGLASRRDDDDGRGTTPEAAEYVPPAGSISPDQVAFIRDELTAKGASEKAFLQWAKQKRIEDIPATHFGSCVNALTNFRKA
ncbi:ERF family protein [Bradyrhizobium ivorense]|uniref:ERF family protein n=1 Tax=Bradyrhizobium ivorense TaxID=2511166 RepID=UPI0010BB0316|nr:ERF family protein [Bradyrhizobium ivorense]VIO73850.1 hypothetical protein CI41S_39590 [Bradyrhizobium ivorense]